MKKLLLILICLSFFDLSAQTKPFIGKYEQSIFDNGVIKTKTVYNPLINNGENRMINETQNHSPYSVNASSTRWTFIDPIAIGSDVAMSGNGLTGVCGWMLNAKRISTYNNLNNSPLWEFSTPTVANRNYVASSDTGVIAVGTQLNVYIFNKNSGTPFFNFDLTTIPDTGVAGPVGITSNGGFIIATACRNDSSTVFGFNKSSNVSVWKFKVPTSVYGVRISGNDSLAIVSTYSYYWVVNTYTGVIRYSAPITNGTQMTQGISGNGNIIATVNYYGFLKVYQWNGSAYTLLWQYQEPTGTYYNWFTSVDVSYDGNYIAGGTLIFLSSSSFDGRLRYFKVSNGSTPLWSYLNLLDEVSWVAFSKNGKILTATSYGDVGDTKEDLLIFKTSSNSNVPIYTVNMPGSPYMCSVSNDGTSVLAGGKKVHARTFGYGGTLYNVFVDTSDNPVNVGNISGSVPKEYKLEQNFPNPFNPSTVIRFQIPAKENGKLKMENSNVTLKVYNVLGKEVATLVNEKLQPGMHEVPFSNIQMPSGVYFYRLETESFTDTKRMLLIK